MLRRPTSLPPLLAKVAGGRKLGARAYLLLALLLLGGAATARAQYSFDQWTADTGLPQNIIRAMHQTPDGYLWLATLDGLVRFDGVRFTVFNRSNSPGINSNRFTALYGDREGALWLGTENGGVTRYHRGRFTTYTTQHGLPSNFVLSISGDKEGNVWLMSGTSVIGWANGKFMTAIPIYGPHQPGEGLTVIQQDKRSGLWGVDSSSLWRFAGGI